MFIYYEFHIIKSKSKSGAANDQATSEESAETEKQLKGSKAADEQDDENEKQSHISKIRHTKHAYN